MTSHLQPLWELNNHLNDISKYKCQKIAVRVSPELSKVKYAQL